MRRIVIATAVLGAVMLTGCSMNGYRGGCWELPVNPVSIEEKDDGDKGQVIYEYNGRSYSPYGTLGSRLTDGTVRDCLGYIGNDKNTRIYSLSEDPYDNYLMIVNVDGIMEQPSFVRAIDTKDKSVFTPEYITSLSYEEWSSSGSYDKIRRASIMTICNAEDIKEIGYEFTVNGRNGGGGAVCNADGSVIGKGELVCIEISEPDLNGKVDLDKPFDVSMVFTVTDKDGNVHNVTGSFEKQMMLGSSVNDIEIRSGAPGEYTLFVDK